MNEEKNNPTFDLDLLPVISIMSVCICFLLLTAVWIQIGSINVEQGLGQESISEEVKSSSLWVTMQANGALKLTMMNESEEALKIPNSLKEKTFLVGTADSGWTDVEKHAAQLKRYMPELKTALIMPERGVNYGDVIRMMDRLKGLEIGNVGIAPL